MSENNLPANLNLFNYAETPDFDSWDKGATANEEYEQSMKSNKMWRRIRPFAMWAAIFFGMGAFGQSAVLGILIWVIAILLAKRSLAGHMLDNAENDANAKLREIQGEHTELCADNVAKKLMIGQWSWFRTGREVLIYSGERFAYLNAAQGSLVAYNNSNIKEVTRERLHTGTHTDSNSNTVGGGTAIGNTGLAVGGAKTSTTSDTTDFYEWHFDILTDFLTYPKVSFVLADSPNTENLIGKAYAILKP